MGENESFQLYANADTLAFKVVDKRSGYVWHSNLDEVSEEDDLNRTWSAFATSGISIDFLDEDADDERASVTSEEHQIDLRPHRGRASRRPSPLSSPPSPWGSRSSWRPTGVRVAVPFDSIREADPAFQAGPAAPVSLLRARPARTSVPGYMFIPDGAGTLIRLAAESKASNMFLGRYYGADLGMSRPPALRPDDQPPLPDFHPRHRHGARREGARLSIEVVEKGAAYGEIRAHPAGVTTKFNFLYNTFIYNQSYFQATNRSGAGVTTLQPATNTFDVAGSLPPAHRR